MVDTIHVHEDVWGMRNLYPRAVQDEVEEDVANAAAAAERNRDPSGVGWTAMYVVKPPSLSYSDLGLTLEQVENAIASILPRVRGFNATCFSAMGGANQDPFGSYEIDAWCFGLGPQCYLKLDAKDILVEGIWFDLATEDETAITRLRTAFEAIDKLVPSMIADYLLDFSGPVSEQQVLDRYFATMAEQRRQAEQAVIEYRARNSKLKTAPGPLSKLLSIFRGKP